MSLKLLVLGATGNTGVEILDLALARGHELTAYVRSPEKITRRDPRLHIVKGDPLRSDQLAKALPGHDAVLSAIGPSTRQAFRAHTLLAECAASTVAAMSSAGIQRLAIVSAALLFPEKTLSFRFFQWLLKHHIRDLVAMEALVRATELDWTIARPPRLVKSAETAYESALDVFPKGGAVLSFRAVASFLLDAVEQASFKRAIVGLARPNSP